MDITAFSFNVLSIDTTDIISCVLKIIINVWDYDLNTSRRLEKYVSLNGTA